MTILQQAKEVQAVAASSATVVIRLSLLEGLIAEIEALQHKVELLSEHHPAHKLRPVRQAAEARKEV